MAEYQKSNKDTRKYRAVTKKHHKNVNRAYVNRIDRGDLAFMLLGTFVKTDIFDDYGRVEAMVIAVYPHNVLAQYYYRKKNDNENSDEKTLYYGPINVSFSTADLVEKGIISFATGRAEVTK